jgi:hypothetical protein
MPPVTTSGSNFNVSFSFHVSPQSDPYGMRRQSSEPLKDNERFEGFGNELIHELSLILGFNYIFELQLDNVYGSLDKKTGQWNGMLRKVMDEVMCTLCISLTYQLWGGDT